MNSTETKVSCPLVWEFDGSGEWSAISRIMDPDMTDEPVERWNRDWCLMWRIHVTEEGQFCCDQSDRLLLKDAWALKECQNTLSQLKGVIDLVEDSLRQQLTFSGGQEIRLLLPNIYNKRT